MQFRAELLQQERGAASQMVRAYGAAYQRIQGQISDLLAQAPSERKVNWLYRDKRLEILRAQILDEMQRFSKFAAESVSDQASGAAIQAQSNAIELIRIATQGRSMPLAPTFIRMPHDAMESIVGAFQLGSALKELFDAIGPQATDAAQAALTSGVAAGHNPRVIAKSVRAALGIGVDRALTISRTETLRAYRESTRQTYAANSDVVSKWRWLCAKSARTCAVCLAMDGQEFDTDVVMGTHPNCRCALVPMTALSESTRETGAQWFAKQDAKTQERILGPAKREAYAAGNLTLGDLVKYRDSPKWGPTRTEKSLAQAVKR